MSVLIETRLNALKLNENASPRKGCLGRLEGICADFKNPTRNGRLYSRKLWENVFNDSIFQESLKSKTLLGELDHPEDRLEVLAGEACIVMTDYSIDEDEGVIRAGFDILDTPRGKILKSLLDYGCVMGVSSRGQGDISTTSNGEVVDEDTYDFACFDVVTTPAVEKARQNVVENVKKTKTFVESIKKQIKEAETVGDLNAIKKVISITQSPEIGSLIESIDNKCKSIKEGNTIASSNNDLQKETITEEPIKENINTSDNNDVTAKTIREQKELLSCINSLRKQNNAYKYRESKLLAVIESKENELNELKESVDTFKSKNRNKSLLNSKLNNENNKLTTANKNLSEKLHRVTIDLTNNANTQISKLEDTLSTKNNTIRNLKESTKQQNESITKLREQIKSSNSEVHSLKEDLNEADNKVRDLEKSIVIKENEIKSLSRSLNSYKAKTEEYKTQISELVETNNSLQQQFEALETDAKAEKRASTITENEMESEINSYTEIIDGLQKQVESLKVQREESAENNKKLLAKCKQLSERIGQYQKTYISTKSRQLGIDPSLVEKYVHNDTTISQINKIVEDAQATKDRYAKLPISEKAPVGIKLDEQHIRQTEEDAELDRLSSFIEKVATGH